MNHLMKASVSAIMVLAVALAMLALPAYMVGAEALAMYLAVASNVVFLIGAAIVIYRRFS